MWHWGGPSPLGRLRLIRLEKRRPAGEGAGTWIARLLRGAKRRHGARSERMPHYVLPDLDYDYAALEPHISGAIMEEHHGKHHKAYVGKANETLEKLDQAREADDFTRIAGLERALAFNLSGHVLH